MGTFELRGGAKVERIPDVHNVVVVASISGGKDGTALSLWLREQGIEHKRVFADTGWEHPSTYEYIDYLEQALGPIERVQSTRGGLAEVAVAKGMFPGKARRWCTSELKFKPIARVLGELDCEVNAIGVRAEGERKREALREWEWSYDMDCHVWRPLLAWSAKDVVDIHVRHGVALNPLYAAGATRVGCWPCIYARKEEVRLLARLDPERVEVIAELELRVQQEADRRQALKGQTPAEWRATFFQDRHGAPMPIREAATWARTDRGGRQLPLFEAPLRSGCERWGLCEGAPAPEGT